MIFTNRGIKNELDYLEEKAIERYITFEPKEGYYLAFSGGKDSIVIYDLAKKANVKFQANYNITNLDPPDLINFIRNNYHNIIFNQPIENVWDLIIRKKYPFTRMARYCCEKLKEHGGDGQFCITGIRWDESNKRKKNRNLVELNAYTNKIIKINDNLIDRRYLENCQMRSKHILNPIIEWKTSHIWEYIKKHNLKYCNLYNKGFKRIGCIGCPMAGKKTRLFEFEMFPKFRDQYIRTFDKMLEKRLQDGNKTTWKNGKEVFNWWLER
jgi:phosphoadenosine phosphosulfate reductase